MKSAGNLLDFGVKRSKNGNIGRKGGYKNDIFFIEIKYAYWDNIEQYSVKEIIFQSSFKVSQGVACMNLAQKEVKTT